MCRGELHKCKPVFSYFLNTSAYFLACTVDHVPINQKEVLLPAGFCNSSQGSLCEVVANEFMLRKQSVGGEQPPQAGVNQ